MNRFVFVGLLVMAWGYWELSGGADFVPESRIASAPAPEEAAVVTRQDTSELDAVAVAPEAPPARAMADPGAASQVDAVIEAVVEDVAAEPQPALQTDPQTVPAEPALADPAATPVADLRVVTGDRVNLREGPGTTWTAIDQLRSGTIAEVLETAADGWVRVQVQGTTTSGWMSADFLAPLNG